MVWSGLQIYWAHRVYTPFVPDSVYKTLGVEYHLADGLALHFSVMWLFVINGIMFTFYLIASGHWRELIPARGTLKDAVHVLLHDLRIRRAPKAPRAKFNGAQKLAYTGVFGMAVLAVLTGVAIYKPIQMNWLTTLFGGYEAARLIHFILAVSFVLFFLVHIAQVIRAGFNAFQSMITGEEVVNEDAQ